MILRTKDGVIPPYITEAHIAEAVRRIEHEGVPRRRRSRGHCLVAGGRHFPPKYTISLAHGVAKGKFLDPDQFSGGAESNRFLGSRNFSVVECACGGIGGAGAMPLTRRDPKPPVDRPSGDGRKRTTDPTRRGGSLPGRTAPVLRVALVFPELKREPVDPSAESLARKMSGCQCRKLGYWPPVVPSADSFAGEKVGFVLFPEHYIHSSEAKQIRSLRKLASDLEAPLLVGAYGTDNLEGRGEVLLRFDPDGFPPTRVYTKHSKADAVAFEMDGWNPSGMLPTFELGGVRAGATICQDHYLGLLQRHLAGRGARLWVNPSFDNVLDVKWSSVLRLRAVENRLFALCTLHDNMGRRAKTHPFAFSPDGNELSARKAGSTERRPLSDCTEAGNVYVVELDVAAAGRPLNWRNLPRASTPKRPRKGNPHKPVRVALRDGSPAVYGKSGWATNIGDSIETDQGRVYLGVVPDESILDSEEFFSVLDRAERARCRPIIWNHWDRLPAGSERLATLMMGRAIECCAPMVVSDRSGIHELVELANKEKFPARRAVETPGEATVDLGNAWGMRSAFKPATEHRPRYAGTALNLYRSLCSQTP